MELELSLFIPMLFIYFILYIIFYFPKLQYTLHPSTPSTAYYYSLYSSIIMYIYNIMIIIIIIIVIYKTEKRVKKEIRHKAVRVKAWNLSIHLSITQHFITKLLSEIEFLVKLRSRFRPHIYAKYHIWHANSNITDILEKLKKYIKF